MTVPPSAHPGPPTTGPCRRDDPAGNRLSLASLQAEAEESGRPDLAAAFRRLGLMTEVWECLADESPEQARDVAAFCADAIETLIGTAADARADDASTRILRESAERWGDYLLLIDPDSRATPGWSDEPPAPDHDDEPSAIDRGALVRLLTGAPSRPEPDEIDPAPTPTRGDRPRVGAPPRPTRETVPIAVPPPPTALAIDPELRDTFLAEAADLFERIETLVLSLGRDQQPAETLPELGRCFHTLKGAAGSVGLTQLAALVHSVEERLGEESGGASEGFVDLLHQLLHYMEGVALALRRGGQTPPSGLDPTEETAPTVFGPPDADEGSGEGPVRVAAERVDELLDLVSELIGRRGLWAAQAVAMKEFAATARGCRNRMMTTIDRLRDLRPGREAPPAPGDRDDPADLPELVGKLGEQADDLVVLTEAAEATAAPLSENGDALARLTLQLWESLQAIRIVPIRGLFQRLARVAHDAARVEGRHVEVVTVGEETGVDRAVQDKAFEPLLHIVRNAVGHGVEPPADRLKVGKPAVGRVVLEAARAGNTLVLTVRDDGRGLDYAAIEAKGKRLGLIGPDGAPGVERLNALVFQPGFSTREEANAIAGRGVGMDVVSQEVGRLHGAVELTSRPGQGTDLIVSLPSRLALQQSIVVRVGGKAFALPVDLVELVQPFEPDDVDGRGSSPRLLIRERWVPLVAAREALGLSTASAVSCPKLLLVRADGGSLAVLVDAIDGARELVVKPLVTLLSGHPFVSGTSLSVTGEAILSLNPAGLARWHRDGGRRVGPSANPDAATQAAPILVVDDSISVRKVVARQLRALGHEVEEVSDGLEALGKLRTRRYALILSDLEMPRMDGCELLAELSRLDIAPAVPVVMASTRSDPETRRRLLGLGASKFLVKPIEPDVLAAVVRDLLRGGDGAARALAIAAVGTANGERS